MQVAMENQHGSLKLNQLDKNDTSKLPSGSGTLQQTQTAPDLELVLIHGPVFIILWSHFPPGTRAHTCKMQPIWEPVLPCRFSLTPISLSTSKWATHPTLCTFPGTVWNVFVQEYCPKPEHVHRHKHSMAGVSGIVCIQSEQQKDSLQRCLVVMNLNVTSWILNEIFIMCFQIHFLISSYKSSTYKTIARWMSLHNIIMPKPCSICKFQATIEQPIIDFQGWYMRD